MQCLVTGAAGFIGSHLSKRLLERGDTVVGVDCFVDYYPREIKERNLEPLRSNAQFSFVEADLRSDNVSELTREADVVFHLAAQAGVRASWGKDFDLYTGHNVTSSQRILEAAKAKIETGGEGSLKKIVYASSSSIYGHALHTENETKPTTEDTTPLPVSPYGVSKLAAEHLMNLYQSEFSVPTASLRYFTVYGPGQRPDMAFNKFSKAALTGELIQVYGDGEQSRDFTFVDDAVSATIAAANAPASPNVFNVGGGMRATVNEILAQLEGIVGSKLRIEYTERQKGDARHTSADTSLATEHLGFRPTVSLEQGLRAEVEWLDSMLSTGVLKG